MPSTSGTLADVDDTVTLTYTNQASGLIGISGTYAGLSVSFEFSADNSNWFGMPGNTPGLPSLTAAYTLAEDETRFFSFSGLQDGLYFRVRATAIESGTADVTISAT